MNFLDDKEKMKDFIKMTKEDFLKFYSYLTVEEYEETEKAFTCSCCKDNINEDTAPFGAIYVENYGYICEDCFIDDYFNDCIKCQKIFLNDDLQMFDVGEGYICENCFKNNYELKLLKVHKEKDSNNFSMLIKEELTKKTFWIDCYEDEHEKGYYTWKFNKYIFYLYNSIDLEDKLLQEIFMSEDVLEGFDCEVDCLIREAIEKGGILNESDK